MFYAYIHAKPSGVPFYIGKGSKKRAYNFWRRNKHYTNIVSKYSAVNILVGKMDCSSEKIAYELEKGLIKCFKRMGVSLVNRTDGGEGGTGYKCSDELRKIRSINGKGRTHSDETRAKMRAFHSGKVFSDSHKANISKAKSGTVVSDETRAKMSALRIGRIVSEETRAKISEVHKGRKHTLESRKNMGQTFKGKSLSAEHRAKQSESLKRFHAEKRASGELNVN